MAKNQITVGLTECLRVFIARQMITTGVSYSNLAAAAFVAYFQLPEPERAKAMAQAMTIKHGHYLLTTDPASGRDQFEPVSDH